MTLAASQVTKCGDYRVDEPLGSHLVHSGHVAQLKQLATRFSDADVVFSQDERQYSYGRKKDKEPPAVPKIDVKKVGWSADIKESCSAFLCSLKRLCAQGHGNWRSIIGHDGSQPCMPQPAMDAVTAFLTKMRV